MTIKKIFAFASLSLAIFFTSCSDDAINAPSYVFDYPRYDYEVDTLHGKHINGGWYLDSTKLFYITFNSLIKYENGNYTEYPWESHYSGYCISGVDENNVYIGGIYVQSNRAFLKKFSGGVFTTFLANEPSSSGFNTVFCKHQNEIWVSSDSGRVYKFNGIDFQLYSFTPDYWYIQPFMKDGAGNVYFAGQTFYGNPVTSFGFDLWKYNGTAWSKIYSDTWSETFYTHNIANEIYAGSRDRIQKFNGSSFTTALSATDAFLMDGYAISGVSMDNLFVSGLSNYNSEMYFLHYNGSRWSLEYKKQNTYTTFYMHGAENTFHAATYDHNINASLVIKGRRR